MGIANSDNWVTAYLMSLFSPYAFARMLKSFGLKSPADPVVSLALGPNDASVYEMAAAYTAFVNRGIGLNRCWLPGSRTPTECGGQLCPQNAGDLQ